MWPRRSRTPCRNALSDREQPANHRTGSSGASPILFPGRWVYPDSPAIPAARQTGGSMSLRRCLPGLLLVAGLAWAQKAADVSGPINISPPPVADDKTVMIDYDI